MTTNDEAPSGRRRIAPRSAETAAETAETTTVAPARKSKKGLPARVVPAADAPRYRKAGRASKLDDYRDQLGKVPDAEIATLTGLTVNAVYVYRVRHGIPMMLKRGQRAPAAAPAAKAAPAAAAAPVAKAPKAAKAEPAAVEAPAAKSSGKGWVWQLEDAQGTVIGMTVGTPQEAGAAIERAGVEAIVIRRLGRLV